MSTKIKKSDSVSSEVKEGRNSARLTVHKLTEYVSPEDHRRLDEMVDDTLYIVKLERMTSEQYGAGMKIWAKDMPNEQGMFTAATFSQNVVAQLEALYVSTHEGKLISLDHPVTVTVRQAGKSYRLE